ncbi:helix-turn-helix domain-containing protein [Halococcus sediminicola]|uniref:helix-turn-helix domain-containing protein n=1 Tax=Halococcus sediminicola TaxID=1264579 RepID=UPI00067913C9|nr:helix-turn-helix domain-containing protein [Halococcus sediminicola]
MSEYDSRPDQQAADDAIMDLLLNEKPAKILRTLREPSKDNYGQAIAYKINSTYSHTLKLLKRFEEHDVVESDTDGRKKIYELTEDGQELADAAEQLLAKTQNREPVQYDDPLVEAESSVI